MPTRILLPKRGEIAYLVPGEIFRERSCDSGGEVLT